ncbi:hypothetical protein ACFYE8_32940 [Rhizobium leguminosarum]|uniref:hypothetical protein n=1 Tax=Rhizobium leguminosarum TaxID=384 RepID=UPI0036DF0F23
MQIVPNLDALVAEVKLMPTDRFADDRDFGEPRDPQRRHGSCRVALHRSVKNLQLTLIIDSRERVSDLAEPVQLEDLMGAPQDGR